jgi:hypothetical protein
VIELGNLTLLPSFADPGMILGHFPGVQLLCVGGDSGSGDGGGGTRRRSSISIGGESSVIADSG